MEISTNLCRNLAKALRIVIAVSIATALFSPLAAAPAPDAASASTTTTGASEQLSPEESLRRAAWRDLMMLAPKPREGCFQAGYPEMQWREVACTEAPSYPMPPRRGPRPLIVGNGDDVSAESPGGFITTAIGSFDSVTGVTSESGPVCSGPAVANAYTLQLNTDFFASTACSGAAVPAACSGWEQFVFENYGTGARAFIQYWLIRYNTTCPAGWTQYSFSGSTDIYCYKNNSLGAVSVPAQAITNLGQLSVTGAVSAGGDSIAMSTGTTVYTVAGDNAVDAAAGWQVAEFNVFGDGCGAQADFNAGSTIVPRTRIFYGGTTAPNCLAVGFTGETNNLSFGPGAPAASAPGPAVFFTESSAGGAVSNCAAATTVGDTHLATFGGLFYDFQASGDFVLAEVDPDFEVQARQVSGAPTWPNASVNSGIATRMGENKVAICLPSPGEKMPTPLIVNGAPTELGDGEVLSLPDGVDIWRQGNVYFVLSASGDSVRAKVNSAWINVSVGLGRWPSEVRGLLANADGDVNRIAAADGVVLTNPFPFEDLYHHYADSWRVPAEASLLSVCGTEGVERGAPKRPFYAADLEPNVYERTRGVCLAAGVQQGPLLEACALDVAVIGDDAAAEVFVGMPAPTAVGAPTGTVAGAVGPGLLLWLLLLVILALLFWLLLRSRRRSP